ncbi:MAG: SMC-Scp complex subunit ScpB [Desulfobacteraceae bacterium IS3]|nr:MAG: SMC-Scp complex subunit ScpB [Desulfobacteraceae bacterium IS3]
MIDDLKNIIESLLFVSDAPLSLDRIKKIIPSADIREIRELLEVIADEHEVRKGGFFLREAAGGWQFCTRPEYNEWVKRLLKPNPARLSKAALETLAIVAYKQPIIRSDVEYLRGVDSGGVLHNLLERKLIRILGRKEIPGRPLIYGTTKQFLEVFDLKDLKDLPSLKEILDLGNNASLENKAQMLLSGLAENKTETGEQAEGKDGAVSETAVSDDLIEATLKDAESADISEEAKISDFNKMVLHSGDDLPEDETGETDFRDDLMTDNDFGHIPDDSESEEDDENI